MKNLETPWDFVEKYYPNYSGCSDIANNSDLQVLFDGEEEEGSKAMELKVSIVFDLFGSIDLDVLKDFLKLLEYNDKVSNLLESSNKYIYERAIEGYIEQLNTFEHGNTN